MTEKTSVGPVTREGIRSARTEALLLAIECAIQFSHAMRDNQEGRVPLALVQTQHDRLRAAVTALVQAWEAK